MRTRLKFQAPGLLQTKPALSPVLLSCAAGELDCVPEPGTSSRSRARRVLTFSYHNKNYSCNCYHSSHYCVLNFLLAVDAGDGAGKFFGIHERKYLIDSSRSFLFRIARFKAATHVSSLSFNDLGKCRFFCTVPLFDGSNVSRIFSTMQAFGKIFFTFLLEIS